MNIQFYASIILQNQIYSDNYKETKDKDLLTVYNGRIIDSKVFKTGELVHVVEYERGTILVQDIDKKINQ